MIQKIFCYKMFPKRTWKFYQIQMMEERAFFLVQVCNICALGIVFTSLDDVLIQILRDLSPVQIVQCELVSKRFQTICRDKRVWRNAPNTHAVVQLLKDAHHTCYNFAQLSRVTKSTKYKTKLSPTVPSLSSTISDLWKFDHVKVKNSTSLRLSYCF
jgi:hypothetical protein